MPLREGDARASIFVSVGTDHHPFDRLSAWIDGWLAEGGAARATCFVQHGTSAAPRLAQSEPYVAYGEMERRMREARVVVSHGGPATLMLARYLGKRPIVVPRERWLGEHVDDHQVLFAQRLAAEGEVEVADAEGRLHELLDAALAGVGGPSRREAHEQVADAVRRFEELVAPLLVPAGHGRA